jgi:O-6-methylguanine DNA methyltransferase
MNDDHYRAGKPTSARALLADLRALGALGEAQAPETIAEGALIRVGLADAYLTFETPLGLVYVAWNARGLSAVTRAESAAAFEQWAYRLLGRQVYRDDTPPQALIHALSAWLAGDAHAQLSFDLRELTPFARAALLKAREIPHGEVRPYSWIAREIGRPGAVRAVGTVMARNPAPVFIPCHRVVRADGHLGAYGLGGPTSKRTILSAEGLDVELLEAFADEGVRYVGRDTDDSYCYPSCHFAQRIAPQHRITFASEAQAQRAGRVPCNVCRPPEARLAS